MTNTIRTVAVVLAIPDRSGETSFLPRLTTRVRKPQVSYFAI